MTREEAIEKIKKLQTLKEGASKVDSEGEMRNAATIIDKLQKQFGITMEEVYSSSVREKESNTRNPETSDSYNSDYSESQIEENIATLRQNIDKGLWRIVRENSKISDPENKRKAVENAFNDYEYSILSNENIQEKCHRLDIDVSYWFDNERSIVENELEEQGYFKEQCINYKVKSNFRENGIPKKKLINFHINWDKALYFFIAMFVIFIVKAMGSGTYRHQYNHHSSYSSSAENYSTNYVEPKYGTTASEKATKEMNKSVAEKAKQFAAAERKAAKAASSN